MSNLDFIATTIDGFHHNPKNLLQILITIQAHLHQIDDVAVAAVASALHLSPNQVVAVIDFYSFLHRHHRGRYEILISDSITDRMLGNQALLQQFCQRLQITPETPRSDLQVSIAPTSCSGFCDEGPAVLINGVALSQLTGERVATICDFIEANTPMDAWPDSLFEHREQIHQRGLLLNLPAPQGEVLNPFFTENQDHCDETAATATIAQLERAALRGRGGAGFHTALKWRLCREAVIARQQQGEHSRAVVICNADEGEPGTFKDRILLVHQAEALIEGMTLCAATVGAEEGFIYLRGEYRYLLPQLTQLLEKRRQAGLLGRQIKGKTFSFDITIHLGAGAYICGEESALIESLEGKQGIPRIRPPFPVSRGYLGQPTVVDNVETFIAAAAIAIKGDAWFNAVGTEKSRGSKLLSISGDCSLPGVYEFPFGITVTEVLRAAGADEKLLGVQVGGPSGTFITPDEFLRTIAFEDLSTGGSFIIFNEKRNLFEIVQNFTHFFAHESCGFCTPCRVGTTLLQRQFDKICDGHGNHDDLTTLQEIAQICKSASHCGLGQTAANPILTTLQRFPVSYQHQLCTNAFEPCFNLDFSLAVTRQLSQRDDADAHLSQQGGASA
ncbi:MAG: NAD(P)H-dependent oxidoreductase subunit E [Gammaproteobacteria bacterium]|nr:NAD(P)H-dependent oxidoreductase subunit E [Gammaproteobacteria bacterium]